MKKAKHFQIWFFVIKIHKSLSASALLFEIVWMFVMFSRNVFSIAFERAPFQYFFNGVTFLWRCFCRNLKYMLCHRKCLTECKQQCTFYSRYKMMSFLFFLAQTSVVTKWHFISEHVNTGLIKAFDLWEIQNYFPKESVTEHRTRKIIRYYQLLWQRATVRMLSFDIIIYIESFWLTILYAWSLWLTFQEMVDKATVCTQHETKICLLFTNIIKCIKTLVVK